MDWLQGRGHPRPGQARAAGAGAPERVDAVLPGATGPRAEGGRSVPVRGSGRQPVRDGHQSRHGGADGRVRGGRRVRSDQGQDGRGLGRHRRGAEAEGQREWPLRIGRRRKTHSAAKHELKSATYV